MTSRTRTWFGAALALSLVLTACGGDDSEEPETTEQSPDETDETEDPDDDDAEPMLDEPVKIAFLGSLSGPFAPWGVPTRNGMQMAVDEINAAGGVLGQQIELLERDTENNPDAAVTALRGLIEQDGIVAAGGVISSDVGLATSRVAEEMQVPLFMVKAGSHRILTPESRYTFRTCLPAAPMIMAPYADFIQEQGITRVGAVIADYEWGHSIEETIASDIESLDGVEVQYETAPVPEQDFTTYLRNLEALDPELIITTSHPPGVASITNQSADLGIAQFTTGALNPQSVVYEAAGATAVDRFVDMSCVDWEDPEYIALAQQYNAEFGSLMEMDAVAGYAMVNAVAASVEGAASVDGAAVAEYLHANEFDTPAFGYPLAWTEWGELAAATPVLGVIRQTEPPEGVNPGADWYIEVLFRSEALEPYVPTE